MLVMVDESTGENSARAIGRNILEDRDWLGKDVSEQLKAWGHGGGPWVKIVLECDRGGTPLKAFRNKVSKFHCGVRISLVPAKGESQTNGNVENAGRLVTEFVRVLKQQLGTKAEMKLQGDEPITHWTRRPVTMVVSRYCVSKDGRIADQTRIGRTCKLVCVPFGEAVWYRKVRDGRQQADKLEAEMREGVSLGHAT